MTLDPLSFGLGISLEALAIALVAWVATLGGDPEREPNTYSKSGQYLIEHENPDSATPYTVWFVNNGLLTLDGIPGFCCATRAEAEELCRVLETGTPPQAAK